MPEPKKNPFADKFNRAEKVPGAAEKKKSLDMPEIVPLERLPGTYRLPPQVHRLIALAVNDSRRAGRKMTKEEAVANAILSAYSHLDQD